MKKLTVIILFAIFSNIFAQFGTDLVSKIYNIKHKPLEELVPLARSLLSKKGKIRESYNLDLITVTDYAENITRIDSLIYKYDIPYRQIEITVILAEGFNSEETNDVSDEVAPLITGIYNFNNLVVVDKGIFRCEEKSNTTLQLGQGEYIFNVLCEYPGGRGNFIKFHQISLSKYVVDIQGRVAKNLFSTTTQIVNDTMSLISASKVDPEDKTLFLIVKAQVL